MEQFKKSYCIGDYGAIFFISSAMMSHFLFIYTGSSLQAMTNCDPIT